MANKKEIEKEIPIEEEIEALTETDGGVGDEVDIDEESIELAKDSDTNDNND